MKEDLEYKMLQKIRLRPAMYTGEMTLQGIITYMNGYSLALHDVGYLNEKFNEISFTDFVAKKLGHSSSVAGVVNMILAYDCGISPKEINWDEFLKQTKTEEQHKNSIQTFYKLLDEYMETYKQFMFL